MSKKSAPKRSVRLLKLVSGPNPIIADVLCQNGTYNLDKPMELVIVPGKDGQTMITLMDFIPAIGQEQVEIDKIHVVCPAKPNDQIIELYNRMVNPGASAAPADEG